MLPYVSFEYLCEVEPINAVKKRQYHPKPWWYYKQRRLQKKLEQQTLPDSIVTTKTKKEKPSAKNRQQSAPVQQSLNLCKQPNFPLNAPKKDVLLYRDDADINITDVKDHIALRCNQHRRDKTMAEFRKESSNCRILVSVNVVGRGIDAEEMDYVINYEIPDSHDSKYRFIQRCGRTGRTRPGTAITFYCKASDKDMAPAIASVLKNAQQLPEFFKNQVLTKGIEESLEQLSINKKGKRKT
uniref:Helicase C-terminal domain-containing protein n=1 Tax=Panagrolaimus davidi TaxID=227884 RepID=A0A914QAL0_9BILA